MRTCKIDKSQFDAWCEKVEAIAKGDANEFYEDFLVKEANRVIAKTKKRTPKATGALRAAWTIDNIKKNGKQTSVEINNPMEYASYVEYGHRGVYIPSLGVTLHTDKYWTAGIFMHKRSLDEVKMQMPARFVAAFMKFLKDKGISK